MATEIKRYETIIALQGLNTLTVELNRADVHHALNPQMIEELTRIFTDAAKDETIRLIILASSGDTFCAGADLGWMKDSINLSEAENCADAEKLANMLLTAYKCPKPIIGKITGSAYGGGLGLISICDMAVAIDTAKFCFSEVKLGLIPAIISPFVLEKMNYGDAKEAMLSACVFDAEKARQSGLIQKVAHSEDELNDWVLERQKLILKAAPAALSRTKNLLQHLKKNPQVDAAIPLTTKLISKQRASVEGQEGISAFIEKRPASWVIIQD
jgi:methylglutaconyl-CoA hydratase